ncbi:F-box protein [Thraustotheca clavata]|uniref:F-box protein n=1 Tax=Thraustotheca clavata TaxID=74557 RepID=A0A1W0A1D7_9STRA|nr:F-box protein [Thraustotheca clavata]
MDDGKEFIRESEYYEQHLTNTTELGEILMTFAAQSLPMSPRKEERNQEIHVIPSSFMYIRNVWNVLPWYVHMFLCTFALLAWWFSFIFIYTLLSTRSAIQQIITIGLLLVCSILVHLLLILLLVLFSPTSAFGYSVWSRVNLTRPPSHLRALVEPFIWVALIISTFALSNSFILSVAIGGITGIAIVLLGDGVQVYIHVARTKLSEEEQPLSLKYIVMTISVGCILRECHQLVWSFLADDRPSLVAWHYLLSILVAVSLIVASELLLLYGPTREAGIILQSRVLSARSNWMSHPLRSFIELSFCFSISILFYDYFNRVLISLQFGTLACTVFILTGEFCFYPGTTMQAAPDNHHWMKFLPLLCLLIFMLYHVGFILALHDRLLLPVLNAAALVAIVLSCFHQNSWMRKQLSSRCSKSMLLSQLWQTCIELIAHCLFSAFLPQNTTIPLAILTNVLFDMGMFIAEYWGMKLWDAVVYWQYAVSYRISITSERQHDNTNHSFNWGTTAPLPFDTFLTSRIDEKQVYKIPVSVFVNASTTYICLISVLCVLCNLLSEEMHILPLLGYSCALACTTGFLIGSIVDGTYFMSVRRLIFTILKEQIELYPLQTFVEVATWLGVCIGTYATSHFLSFALILATISFLVVSACGRYVSSRIIHKQEGRDKFSAACALLFFVVFMTYATGVCLFNIYCHFHRIEVAFCLATLSGVVFVASSELCLLWEPTRAAGYILQTRVTQAPSNWRHEPLRSFLELFIWISVTYGSFALYQDLIMALQLGTFSGIVVTLAGEIFRNQRQSLFPENHETIEHLHNQRPKVLPLLLLFAYIGAGTFTWIFEHLRRIEVMVGLATIAGIIFLCFADILVMWTPTRWAGLILQDRFLQAATNWQEYPVRSFVELGCFLGVIYGSHAIYGDLTVAVQCGTLSGMCVALIGDQLKSHRRIPPQEKQHRILPLPIIVLLSFVGIVAFNTIYTHLRSIEVAFVLATTSSVAFVVLGDMFVIWRPTRYVGLIVQERILNAKNNFVSYRLRSYGEILAATLVLYVSYVWSHDLLIAMQFGTFTGIALCVINDTISNYLSAHKKRMLTLASGKSDSQENANLLSMPYEVLFEIGRFLTPEELLVARATCHKVNNLLRAESARFWLHAHLRRQGKRFGLHPSRLLPHRSLIYEACKALVPNFWAPWEPATLLTAQIARNRALKWVFLNADWIRHQNMPPLLTDTSTLELYPQDQGFEVFRHLPDKDVLGIIVIRGIDLPSNIVRIDVPVRLYSKIQADPFSFVVSETLYEVEACSNVHLVYIVFLCMTVICAGHAVGQFIM